jgi:membrane protein DedA with SNARE-associated domain
MTWLDDLNNMTASIGGSEPFHAAGWLALLGIGLVMVIPFGPTEPAAAAAGVLASTGAVPPWIAVFAVATSMLLGDILTYRASGPLLRQLRNRRSDRGHTGRVKSALETRPIWRAIGVAGLRFVPGARTPINLGARDVEMGLPHFSLVAGVGSLVWAIVWTGGGTAIAFSA